MLLYADGFDHWGNTAACVSGSPFVEHNASMQINMGGGRTGPGFTYQINFGGGAGWCSKIIGGDSTEMVFGLACQYGSFTGNLEMGLMLCDAEGASQVTLNVTSTGGLAAFCQSGRYDSNPGVLTLNAFNYIELKSVCDSVNGEIHVQVNGVPVIAVTGVNTNGQGTGHLNSVSWGKLRGGDTASYANYDDMYILNGDGGRNNDFLGDIRCRTIYPILNGADQDWNPIGDANAFDCVAHVPANPNVDYIAAATVGDVSSFGMTQIPTNTSAVNGIVQFVNANKSDAGICEITPGIDSNGNVANGEPIGPGTGAGYYHSIYEADPNGGGNFTYASINALLTRAERTA